MPSLFSPYQLKSVNLRNRIVASPMSLYQSRDGYLNDFHHSHYTMLGRGGVGLVVVEAAAVTPEGRITLGDPGLWSDDHVASFAKTASAIKGTGAVAGVQLAHAGRKAGTTPPWEGHAPIAKTDPQAWEPMAPSALTYMPSAPHIPRAMTLQDIAEVQQSFVDAARRAFDAGFEWLELHFAHGFLAQTFLSSNTNQREDQYGGSLENRARFLIETTAAVRQVWPGHLPLTMRLGVVEFAGDEQRSFAESIEVLKWLKAAGLDLVDVGLALTTPAEQVPWGPNFMVPYAEQVKAATGLPVSTSWLIKKALQADAFIREEKLDLVFLGRTLLANPHWAYQAALELGLEEPGSVLPVSYAYWLRNWKSEP